MHTNFYSMINIRYYALIALAGFLCLASCKKNDTGNSGVAAYLKLQAGNYWVYQSYIVDDAGVGNPGSIPNGPTVYDSIYVASDTMIRNRVYHRLVRPVEIGSALYQTICLRDSLNYEVDDRGNVYLAPDDYSTVFLTKDMEGGVVSTDSAIRLQVRMGDRDKIMTVPAGSFTTVSMDQRWTFFPFAAQGRPVNTRIMHARFAKGIGMISETLPFYASFPLYTERRLVRYRVQ